MKMLNLNKRWTTEKNTDTLFSQSLNIKDKDLTYNAMLLCCNEQENIKSLIVNGQEAEKTNHIRCTNAFDIKPLLMKGKNHLNIRVSDTDLPKGIHIEAYKFARLHDICINQSSFGDIVMLSVEPIVESWSENILTQVTLIDPDGMEIGLSRCLLGKNCAFLIDFPRMCSSDEHEVQPLYTVNVTLFHNDTELETGFRKFGLIYQEGSTLS